MNCETQKEDNIFILNSGCIQPMVKSNMEKHMKNTKKNRESSADYDGKRKNNDCKQDKNHESRKIKLNALIVNGMSYNWLSVGKLIENNNDIIVKKKKFIY